MRSNLKNFFVSIFLNTFNKYYDKQGVKQFTVVYNKTLLSLAPDWEQRGYEITGWVSQADGLVTRTKDGNYVKDTSQ